ncbi:MAG: hypothetical protein GC147_02345 [Porphyrobacter sp.]|nr:hypothetical protein [Porphyrobacter sp.]
MRNLALAAACMALFACAPDHEPSSPPGAGADEGDVESEPPLAPVADLSGEYRVAGIDGAPLDAPFGIAVSVVDNRIALDAPCGTFAWTYRMQDARLTTQRTGPAGDGCTQDSPVRAAAAALGAATTAGRDASNAVVLSGGGHALTLYSQ